MPNNYALISLLEDATLPVTWSSASRGKAGFEILTSGDLFAVFEDYPLNVRQCAAQINGDSVEEAIFKHPYALSVFYRKSRNPHGPSSRPIFIATYEYTEMTCRMKRPGFFGLLTGEKAQPLEVHMIGNSTAGRRNAGCFPFDFTKSAAQKRLADFASESLGLSEPLRYVGTTSKPFDPRYTD
jgi:hypothetical protein